MFKVNDLVIVTNVDHQPENPEWNQFYGRSGVVAGVHEGSGVFLEIFDENSGECESSNPFHPQYLRVYFANSEVTKIGVL